MRTRDHVIFAVLLYILSVQYLTSEASGVLLSPFLPIYLFLTMVGALFPDVDWVVMRVWSGFGHRNPITHSVLVPMLLYFPLHHFDLFQESTVRAAYNAFSLGMASHLLGDLIKTSNVVWIPKRHENKWFILNGVMLIALLISTGFLTG